MTAHPPADNQKDPRRTSNGTHVPPNKRPTNGRAAPNPAQTNGNAARPVANRGPNAAATNPTKPKDEVVDVPVLILGSQGCGKSSLINAAFANNVRKLSNGFEPATKEFQSVTLAAGKNQFVLVDSPGFDNTLIGGDELVTRLIRFLCCGKAGAPAQMAGVIYIHPQDARLGSGALKKSLNLVKLLLGNTFMDRLTILLVPRPGTQLDHEELARPLLDPKSPFYPLFESGARVDISTLDTKPIRDILMSFTGRPPASMSVQSELCKPGRSLHDTDISFYLGKCARAMEGTSVATKPKVVAPTIPQNQTKKAAPTQNNSSEIKKLQNELAESKKQREEFSTQLQQHLSQYTALCSQLQIHENIEQSQLVQSLIDLNRGIEDFALSLSQHLVDTYGGNKITTTLHAFQLSELKRLFEHEDGKASLVLSSKGVGMPLEDFLDVAIRSILCEHIYKRIFAPFHPGLSLSDPKNGYTASLYARIREKESQATLGRWRTASFTAISGIIGAQELSRLKKKVELDILNDNLLPMLRHIFGPKKNAQPQAAHVKELSELIAQAWDWCVVLKEKVVLLGDFQPVAYRYGGAFDHEIMTEFEPRRGGKPPSRILSTIGLGLNALYAQSSGEGPDRAVLYKTSVVTEGWFERP